MVDETPEIRRQKTGKGVDEPAFFALFAALHSYMLDGSLDGRKQIVGRFTGPELSVIQSLFLQ